LGGFYLPSQQLDFVLQVLEVFGECLEVFFS
jgi:hypothetical protein